MEFSSLIQKRRSHRKYAASPISDADLKLILRAALMSPSSKGRRSWHFVVVSDKDVLQSLSTAKESNSAFVSEASHAIVVIAEESENDCWIEDGSIAAFAMQLQAEDLGIGSCWIQIRDKQHASGDISAEAYIRRLLMIPDRFRVLCYLAMGHKAEERKLQNEERLKWDQVHYDVFSPEK